MDRANINELISFNYELLIEIETNCAAGWRQAVKKEKKKHTHTIEGNGMDNHGMIATDKRKTSEQLHDEYVTSAWIRVSGFIYILHRIF